MGEFGNKFREAREKKELSLDDVSNVTKISSRMLQAIEQEHFDQLPGGVFNKGFIRAYAKHLGLNGDEAVSDYLACLRQAQIDSHAGWDADPRSGRSAAQKSPEQKSPAPAAKVTPKVAPKPEPVEPVDELPELQLPRAEHVRAGKKEYLGRPAAQIPWRLIGVAALLVLAGIFFWMRHSRSAQATTAKPTAPPVTASAAAPVTPAATSPVAPATSTVTPSTPVPSSVAPPQQQAAAPSATGAPSTNPTVAPGPGAEQSTDSDDLAVARPKPSSTTSVADPSQVKVEKKGDVTIRSFGGTSSKPVEKSAATLTVVVRASENSWISVTSDGQLVTQETLIAPAATSFHASRELVVRVGNAAGVSFLWKGDEFPAQGAEAEAKTFIFDAQGMRPGTPPQPSAQN